MKSKNLYTLYRRYLLLLAIFCILPGCLDIIELDPPEGLEDAITVQGVLIKGRPSIVEIRLSRLYNFSLSSIGPINALQAFLKDETGEQLELRRIADGFYRLVIPDNHPTFQVNYNQSYAIELRMPNGGTIISQMEPLIPVTKIDAIHFERVTKFVPSVLDVDQSMLDTFVRFSIDTPLKLADQTDWARFRWLAERTYKFTELPQFFPPRDTCYLTEAVSIFDPRLHDGNQLKNDYLSGQIIFDQSLNFKLTEGYYFSVYQESLSAGAYTYWSQIDQLLNRSGDMFESPAGSTFTNLEYTDDRDDRLYGYFYCTERDTLRQYVSPVEITTQATYCPQFIGQMNIPDICFFCELEARSVTSPPSFWIE
ncbi:MAG: hypothetical protein Sapg2KO_15940 [Saprospiraceae bacterium]